LKQGHNLYTAHHTSLLYVRTVYLVKTNRLWRLTKQHQIQATPHFIVSDLWPLNILLTWIQLTIHSGVEFDVADLKRRLTAAWSGLHEHVIDEANNQQRGRLCTCVRTDGRHLKHLLW